MTDEPPPILRQALEADFIEGATRVHPVASDGLRAVKINSESSRELADMAGTLEDLRKTIAYCDRYLELFDSPDRVLVDALCTAALIDYYRATTHTGLNARVDMSSLDGVEGAMDAHRYFHDLRSKYIAHSVNALEQSEVVAFLTDSPADREVRQVAVGHLTFAPLDRDGASQLRWLAERFGTEIQNRVDAATSRVRAEVDALPLDEVYALPDVEFEIPDTEAQGGARSKS